MATRTISDAGGNWNSVGTWVEGAVPTSADAVVATGTSGNLTINVTNAICLTFIMTSYVGTLTISGTNKLTVNSTLTFVSGMGLSGNGILGLGNTVATITSGGLTIPFSMITSGGGKTLGDNWDVDNNFTQVSSTTFNSNTLYLGANFTQQSNISGTTNIILDGTGIWSCSSSSVYCYLNITINTAGTITLGANTGIRGGTLTYTAGTIDVTTNSNSLNIGSANTTLSADGINWYKMSLALANSILTLTNNLTCTNTMTLVNGLSFAGNYNISVDILAITTNSGLNFKFVAGTTLTVATSIISLNQSPLTSTIMSVTPSSAFNLVYNGTLANLKVVGVTFTDVDASGSAVPIFNWHGGALTRTANIYNIDGSDFPAVADVKDTVVYAGGALTGTYAGGGSINDVFGMVG